MHEDVQMILDMAKEAMEASITHLEKELTKIRAGKANPIMLEGVLVEYYGAMTPLNQLAAVSAPDARMLMVTPFDKGSVAAVEQAIVAANLGLNPSNDGAIIRVPVPALSEERRKDLAKAAGGEGENAKISIRSARKSANDELKELKDDGVSEDIIKGGEEQVQKLTNSYGDKVDAIIKKKEEDIMTI